MNIIVASDISLQNAIGLLREEYRKRGWFKFRILDDQRTIDQNAISHAWYEQIARELREYDALGVKCECKLRYGVPILRAEDDDFRGMYDAAIKDRSYEEKLAVMKYLPVTSLMTKRQISQYLETIQADYAKRGVVLEFPQEAA